MINVKNLFSLSLALLTVAQAARAADMDLSHPLTTGIVFTNMGDALSLNPAGLAGGSAGELRATYDHAPGAIDQYDGSFVTSNRGFGFGAGVSTVTQGGFSVSSGVLGAGMAMGPIALGVNANMSQISSSGVNISNAQVSAGLLIGKGDGLQLGAVVAPVTGSLLTDGNLTVGVGYARARKFQLELDLVAPFSPGAGLPYTLTASAVTYFGKLGLGAFGSADSSTDFSQLGNYGYGVDGLVRVSRSLLIDAKYSLSGGDNNLVIGLSVVF